MKLRLIFTALATAIVTGCATTGHFQIPAGTELYVYDRPQPVEITADGTVKTTPFFWTAVTGIPYRLERDGEVIQRGKLESKFRVVSIFWPPAAAIYWPIGFIETKTYDLTP